MIRFEEALLKGLDGLGLDADERQVAACELLAHELAKWNRKINLTAITRPEDVAVKHFIDSLTVVHLLDPSATLLDIGSGAGFPGLPLKIFLPGLRVTSIDAVEKKVMFQRHAARVIGLSEFTAVHGRVEDLARSKGPFFDIIISRAFSELGSFIRVAYPLLADCGIMIAMKGSEGMMELERSGKEIEEFNLAVTWVEKMALPLTGEQRVLIKLEKTN